MKKIVYTKRKKHNVRNTNSNGTNSLHMIKHWTVYPYLNFQNHLTVLILLSFFTFISSVRNFFQHILLSLIQIKMH